MAEKIQTSDIKNLVPRPGFGLFSRMKIFEKKEDLKRLLDTFSKKKKSIGFVPTMGALHDGHLALVQRAKKENDLVVCSIFVNPTQFNNREDLKKYPRTLKADIRKLESVKCDVLFAPDEKEMYPKNDPEKELEIDFGLLDKVMEGKFRPGHFKGVAMVVNKLFRIVMPQKAYFGEKDYQQLLIIKKMARLLKHRLRIVACATVREKDGLAMSSRNMRLTPEEREQAPFIYRVLKESKSLARKKNSARKLKEWAGKQFSANNYFKLEYFEIADAASLMPIKKWSDAGRAVICIAAYLGKVRLIDNIKI